VTGHPCSALTLIIDHDLGFMMWLGELFTELGYQTAPASNCRQALALIQRIDLPIAILVINPELRGAKRMIKALVAANPNLRLVLIRGAAAAESDIQAPFTLERPSPAETISRPDWAARIRKVLI
jgi:ActR/RegA family two-component response regulator